jgi:hypothetical protein
MKPKPFWPLNHFTVPLFMGDLSSDTSMVSRAQTQPVCFEILEESRQSGALLRQGQFVRPKTRCALHRVSLRVSQGKTAIPKK